MDEVVVSAPVAEAPVAEAQGQEGTQQAQPQEPQQAPKWAGFSDQDKIAFMRESLGDLPKGTEIKIMNGKPVVVGKANGKEFVKNFDQLVRDYQFTEAANDNFERAKQAAKQAEEQKAFSQQLVNHLINNPQYYFHMLKEAGYRDHEINELAAKQLQQAIEEAETPEEVKQLKKFQKENEDLKKRLEEIEAEKRANVERAQLEQHYEAKKTELYKAMEEVGLFDKDVTEDVRYNFAKVALYWMKQAEDQNIEGFTAQKAVQKAIRDMQQSNKFFFSKLKPEERIKHLPEDMARVLAGSMPNKTQVIPTANNLAQMKQAQRPKGLATEQPVKKSLNDYFNNL